MSEANRTTTAANVKCSSYVPTNLADILILDTWIPIHLNLTSDPYMFQPKDPESE